MKLYSYFESSSSYRVRIALQLKEIEAEMAYINLRKGEQRSAEYAAINPEMVVPTLIDHGHTLSQSLAILEYLDEAYPAPPLMPSDVFARAYVRDLAQIIACDTAPLANLKIRKHLAGALEQSDEAVAAWIRHWIAEGLAAFEKVLECSAYMGKFCCGDTPTIADCCLIPQVYNAMRWKCDLAAYPRVRAIAAACETHPAFIAAHPAQQKDAI